MVAWASIALIACSSSDSGAHASGELGNGTFDYTCTSGTDPVCRGGAPAEDFPSCVLRGGEFHIGYTVHDHDELDDLGSAFIHVETASKSYFSGIDNVTAVQVGNAAFVAFADDHVLDILHLEIVEPTEIELMFGGVSDPSVVEVELGGSALVYAYGESVTCEAGGALPVTATTDDPLIAEASGDGGVALLGHAEGETTVHVTMAGMTRSFTVRVVPALDPTDTDGTTINDTDATTTLGDSGSDSGTDSGTDSGSESGTDSGTDSGTTGDASGTTGDTDGTTGTGG